MRHFFVSMTMLLSLLIAPLISLADDKVADWSKLQIDELLGLYRDFHSNPMKILDYSQVYIKAVVAADKKEEEKK